MIKLLFIEFIKRFWFLLFFLSVGLAATLYAIAWDHKVFSEIYTRESWNEFVGIIVRGEW